MASQTEPRPPSAPRQVMVTVELWSRWRKARSATLLVVVIALVGAALALVIGAALTLVGLALRNAVT